MDDSLGQKIAGIADSLISFESALLTIRAPCAG